MQKLQEIFNTRELALLTYVVVVVLPWFLLSKSRRQHLRRLIATAFATELRIVFAVMFTYIALVVLILAKLNIWDCGQLKNTILWTVSYAFINLLGISKIQEDKAYFKDALKDIFAFTAAIEFLVGVHTFSFWIELIILPFTTFLIGSVTFAGNKKEYAPVKKFFNSILALVGSFLIVYALYWIATHFKSFAVKGTLTDFFVTPILSLLFLPFIYLLSVYMSYEMAFVGLINAFKDPKLLSLAKRKAIFHFNFRVKELHRWKNWLRLNPIQTKQELLASFQKEKELSRIESNPPEVDVIRGWSPYKAKDFLTKDGLNTDFYNHHWEDEWGACSNYLQLNESEIISNHISYYVTGDEQVADKLKLSLAVSEPQFSETAHLKLVDIAKSLHKEAMKKDLPAKVEAAIKSALNISLVDGNMQITVLKENWPNNRVKGYNLVVEIKVVNAN